MARLIVKSPYIKCGGGHSAGGYMRYIATRERVELIQDDRPPTRKQEQLIVKLVKDFPEASLSAIDNFLKIVVSLGWLFRKGYGIVCR